MRVRLPAKPDGNQYEDAVAATAIVRGYYVETRVVLSDGGKHVLELDVVATPTGGGPNDRVLLEAKTGRTGFPDLFKVFGQMQYLGIGSGFLVRLKPLEAREIAAAETIGKRTGASCVVFDPTDSDATTFLPLAGTLDNEDHRERLRRAAWYGQIASRIARKAFLDFANSHTSTVAEAAKHYVRQVEDSFFATCPEERADSLRSAYASSPRLVGALIEEQADIATSKPMWDKFRNKSGDLWLQYIGAVEHRARIALIKCAVDSVLFPGDDNMKAQAMLRKALPSTYADAMKALDEVDDLGSVPYAIQIFVELFGGFLVDSEEDRDLVASVAGVSVEDLQKAIGLFERFYPLTGGWNFVFPMRSGDQTVTALKLVPAYLRGVGCFARSFVCKSADYGRYGDAGFQLAEWYDALVEVVSTELAAA